MSTNDITDFANHIRPRRELAVIEDRLNHKLNYNIYDIDFIIEPNMSAVTKSRLEMSPWNLF